MNPLSNKLGKRSSKLRELDTGVAPRSLMMIDGVRYPPQGNQTCQLDPSIIPSVAIARVDLLLDGASATYGSDAIGGVINIILKRGYDGAQTEIGYTTGHGGHQQRLASQLWGRSWDGGNITLGYQWFDVSPTKGNFNSKFTFDHTAWGLDNRIPLASSIPGTLSTGAPANTLTDTNFYPANLGSNCTNCFAIPRGAGADFNPINNGIGPTAPFSASTLNWGAFNTPANRGTNGTRNEFNPYSITNYSAGLQYNGGFVTIDQRLTRDVSFYGEAFYGMRRANLFTNDLQQLLSVAVPTSNPYYPTGGAPTNLRVNYNFGIEEPSVWKTWARGMRYLGGLNIALARGWEAQLFYSLTQDNESIPLFGVRSAQVSAALGWTMPVTPANGTAPAIGTWTKPASVPYRNLFCDPTVFRCNADATLSYIESIQRADEYFSVNEKGIKADGPLFDLPGGQVKAAIGANYSASHYFRQVVQTNGTNPILSILSDPESRLVWAVFGQVNVPIIGEANALPMVRRLELETSWRHDQYSDFGGTSNPRLGLNWGISEDWGLTVRGSWGTSFRAPNFQENGTAQTLGITAVGLPADINTGPNNTTQVLIACDASGRPAAGSAAEKLFNAGFGCNAQTAGLGVNGGARAVADLGLRTYVNSDEQHLGPERSTNWSLGFDIVPQRFLKGLAIQATWYSIKIEGILRSLGGGTTTPFNDPGLGFDYVVPSDLKDPNTGAQLCPGMDATPTLCAPFQKIVATALAQPTNGGVRPDAQTLIYWIGDSGTLNKGWQKNTGIDWTAGYDWDMGDIGDWNTGIAGTYYLGQDTVVVPGAQGPQGAVVDNLYHTTVNAGRGLVIDGVALRPRMKYRARLGWAKGPWSVTAFMDYESHFFHSQASPPNVNSNCLTAGGTVGGGTFPCLIDNYTNIQPSYYSFDLSAGYDTGDAPANDYLRNIGIQLVVQNVADRHSPYEYRISAGGGQQCACDIIKSLYGRRVQIRLVKTW